MEGPYTAETAQSIVDNSVCGECGSNLLNPWGGSYGVDGHVVRCVKDVEHQGVRPRGRQTKKLLGVEYDVMTQAPVVANQALALPNTEQGMLGRMNEANSIGLFPSGKNVPVPTEKQLANLAKIALLYGLDPLMREIMPFQGQPYITIEGRRRIDARAGNHPSYKIRPMDKETYDAYVAMGAINEGDVVVVGEFTDTRFGNSIEATGRVLKSETTGNDFLPTVKWRLEMAHKRCEARGRKMLYGPVALPGGAESKMRMVEEGDEVIEGGYREITDHELSQPSASPNEKNSDSAPAETPTGEILGPDEALDATAAPETYHAMLETAGKHGLDLDGFCEQVLDKMSIAAFEKIGGTPAIAEKRLANWVKKQEAMV